MKSIQSLDSAQTTAVERKPAATRVLHVINGEHYAGAERVQDLLALNLPQFGYEAAFACVKPGQFSEKRVAQAVQLFDVSMRSRFDCGVARRLSRIVRDGDFSIIHAHTPRSAIVGRLAAAFAGVPMVYHVHSPTARDTTHRCRNMANQWLERLSLFRVRAMIAVSNSLGRHMRTEGYADNRITVVQNGVPTPTLLRNSQPPQGEWQVGTVALFRPRKGLEILLHAMSALREQNVAVRLRAVGPFETPGYEQQIRELVEQLDLSDRIDWVGFTSDVPSELARLDLFVLPSLFGEGLPMVVLEAMAGGVPVIGTRVEGVPEAIDDGVSGLIAEPSDSADLARCIRSVISGDIDWLTLRDNAITAHADQFSAEQMARGVAKVYDRVLLGN